MENDTLSSGNGLTEIREHVAAQGAGQSILFDRSEYNITKITTSGIDCTINTDDDITTVLQFDDYGRLKAKYSTTNEKELGAHNLELTDGESNSSNSNTKKLNRVSIANSMTPFVNNLLVNHSGESTTNWSYSSSIDDTTFTFASTTDEYLFGQKSFKINATVGSATGRSRCYQNVTTDYLKPDTTYTASAYVKTDNITKVSGAGAYGAMIEFYINADVTEHYYSEFITGDFND